MSHKHPFIQLLLTALLFTSCDTGLRNGTKSDTDTSNKSHQIVQIKADSVELIASFQETDSPANEYLFQELKPIRANFKRINSIEHWNHIKTLELWETTEGGEALLYECNGILEKIITRQYGETFQLLTEYYLLNGKPSFVLEKSYRYNRPMYYDSIAMKEMNDNETFDFEKSEILEDRSYFENGQLIHQINNQDCGAPFEESYLLAEQKRILADFKKLVSASKKLAIKVKKQHD